MNECIFSVARKGIPVCVLFRGTVRNGIPRICTERNSEWCSLLQKGSEQNYGSLLLFLFHGTEFRVIFSSAEGFGTEFWDFLFRGTTGIPSEITICSVYSVFRDINFLSEIPNPMPAHHSRIYLCVCGLTSHAYVPCWRATKLSRPPTLGGGGGRSAIDGSPPALTSFFPPSFHPFWAI